MFDNLNTYHGYAYNEPAGERRDMFEKQMVERGFDDTETWSLYTTIAKFTLPRLKRYYELADEMIDLDHHEGFREGIEKMIVAFELIVEDGDWSKENNDKISEGLEAFAKWYRYLWW